MSGVARAITTAIVTGAVTLAMPGVVATAHPAAPVTGGTGPVGVVDPTRLAKIGLAGFILDHVDRPLTVDDPCPTVPAASIGAWLTAAGSVPSGREHGVAIVWDHAVGGGLTAVRCGVDLARGAEPAGSVGWSVDVAMLDGQATFAQLAVSIGGRDVTVVDLAGEPELARLGASEAELAVRCTNGGRDCTAAVGVDGLVEILRLRALPADGGEALTRRLAIGAMPEIVANLAVQAAHHG
jgi:hypothetical protein